MRLNYLKATQLPRAFLPPSPQKFLVLIWSSSKGWKAESTLKPINSFSISNLRIFAIVARYGQ